jgi:hypothetical protein
MTEFERRRDRVEPQPLPAAPHVTLDPLRASPGFCQACGEFVGDRGAMWQHHAERHAAFPPPSQTAPPPTPQSPLGPPGASGARTVPEMRARRIRTRFAGAHESMPGERLLWASALSEKGLGIVSKSQNISRTGNLGVGPAPKGGFKGTVPRHAGSERSLDPGQPGSNETWGALAGQNYTANGRKPTPDVLARRRANNRGR